MFIKTLLTSLDSLNLENVKNTIYNDTLVVEISGWIKTYRNQREISFMAINDGSSQQNLQVLFDTSTYFAKEEDVQVIKTKIDKLSVGASVELRGILVKPPDSS